jgi:hypothetical protein
MCLSSSFGQTDTLLVLFKGQLINAENKEAVPFANIYFKYNKSLIASNDSGFFQTRVLCRDSVLITSIGFEDLEFSLKEYISDSTNNVIELKPTIYQLSEVEIRALPGYSALKRLIATAEPSREEKMQRRFYENLKRMGIANMDLRVGRKGFGGPISALFGAFNKHEKSKRKVQRLISLDNQSKIIERKYSPVIVSRITGMTDEKMIDKFMDYCNFSENFILITGEFELYNLIAKKFNPHCSF